MMLEAAQHGDNCFATLTYADEKLPEDLSVSPREISLFIKRLRKAGYSFRYFATGEYGENFGRPHYHLALFGFPSCRWGITRKREYCCSQCEAVKLAWGNGHILLGDLNPKSMAYVASYINKKMTKTDDPRLEGRLPEFARMSLRPGIGHGMMHELASTLMEHSLDKKMRDVPVMLCHGEKATYPLGRYLRRSLRKMIGRDPNTPPEVMEEYKKKMQPLREAAFEASIPFKTAVLEATKGKRIQIEARYRRNRGKKL